MKYQVSCNVSCKLRGRMTVKTEENHGVHKILYATQNKIMLTTFILQFPDVILRFSSTEEK